MNSKEENKFKNMKSVDSNKDKTFYCSLSDLMISIGDGVRIAQEELDITSLELEMESRRNPDLKSLSLSNTWFSINEVEIELKVHILPQKDNTGFNLRVAPLNASFSNFFMSK